MYYENVRRTRLKLEIKDNCYEEPGAKDQDFKDNAQTKLIG